MEENSLNEIYRILSQSWKKMDEQEQKTEREKVFQAVCILCNFIIKMGYQDPIEIQERFWILMASYVYQTKGEQIHICYKPLYDRMIAEYLEEKNEKHDQ